VTVYQLRTTDPDNDNYNGNTNDKNTTFNNNNNNTRSCVCVQTGETHVPGVDAVLVVHEPTRPRRATQQWEQVVGLQEQVGGLVHPPPARPGVPGQVVQEPAG